MHSLPLLFHDALARLQALKDYLVSHYGSLPVVGDMLGEIPVWFYGALTVFVALFILFTFFETIAILRRKALMRIQGSSLGAAKEKRRMLSEAAKMARKKNYSRAAELYLSVDEVKLAAEMLEDGGLHAKAGQLYERLGDLDRAIELYDASGEYGWLAEALMKKGNYSGAGETFLKTGKKTLAAEAFEKAGRHSEAARLFEEAGHTVSAAFHYEKCQNYEKAALLYDRACIEGLSSQESKTPDKAKVIEDYSLKAGTFYMKTGNFEKAAEAFSRCKAFLQAGEAALAGGSHLRAAEYFTAAREFERAAEIYRENGNDRKASEITAEQHLAQGDGLHAAEMFMQAGEFPRAAELFDQAGEYAKAGEAYMREGEFAAAAEMFIKAGSKDMAADAYIKGGELKLASEIFISADETDKACELLEQAGDYFAAAELYKKSGDGEKELSALQRVPPGDPAFQEASARLAEAFRFTGNLRLAGEKYLQAIGGAEPDATNVSLYFGLGTVYESAKKYSQALKIYRKVQLADFKYEDVEERIQRCMGLQGQSEPSTPGKPARSAEARADANKRYAAIQEIGRGGMGVVYKAKDNHLNRIVALKLLPRSISDNPNVIKRFVSEARSAAQLNHQNIVTLFDFNQAGGRSFITMEYVEGVTLKKLMTMTDKLPVSKAVKIIYQCCQGLDYAHKKGIVHRDIKPSNIMISKQNVVKIMDFGLAKIQGEETISEAGTISGTLLYMAPEQILGEKLDGRTDLYALGIVFYELVTGKHPFAEGDAAYHHIHTAPKPPKSLRPEIPDELNGIIMRALEKDAKKRLDDARQLAVALRQVPLGKP